MKRQKKFGRKLRLNKETIAVLNGKNMVKVVGGETGGTCTCCDTSITTSETCYTCETCQNPCPVLITEPFC